MLATLIFRMASLSSSPASSYRGRLAPSPTGYLHVGHARTFWTAYQRAISRRRHSGHAHEDLDPDRSRAEYAEAALEDLHWWESAGKKASPSTGRMLPTSRDAARDLFDAWRKLLRGGFLFPCRCSARIWKPLSARRTKNLSHSNAEQEPLDDEPFIPAPAATVKSPQAISSSRGNFHGASACLTVK